MSIDLGETERIGEGAFADCKRLSDIELPDSVTSVADDAFTGCTALKTMTIGAGLTTFNARTVAGCTRLNSIQVSEENTGLKDVNGVLFSHDMKRLVCYPRKKAGETYAIPDGTESIGAYAFDGAKDLTEVTAPATVTDIEAYAFKGCRGLQRFSGSGVTQIGTGAFAHCAMMEEATFSANLSAIGALAFIGCSRLESLSIPESATMDIRDEIFGNAKQVLIIGKRNSSAHAYATAYGLAFIDPDEVTVTGIEITGEANALERGETMPLTVTLTPGDAATGTGWRWYSSDEKIAFVDENNIVHAIGVGNATLTAMTDNGLTAEYEIEVKVTARQAILKLEAASSKRYLLTLDGYEDGRVTPVFTPADATDQSVRFVSSDPDVVTVDSEGNISAAGKGTATITIIGGERYAENFTARCEITVCQVNTIMILPDALNEIEENAFSGTDAEAVIIPDGCTRIGAGAFEGCEKLVYVSYKQGTEVGDAAFVGCGEIVFEER